MHFTLTPKRYLVLVAVMLTAALGDTCLSLGMKQMGAVPLEHGGHMVWTLLASLRDPWVVCGVLLLLGFFAAQLTALSWADLSFVLPATSFSYVIMTVLARCALHEHVSLRRWAGVLLITTGVGFITRGPSLTAPKLVEEPA